MNAYELLNNDLQKAKATVARLERVLEILEQQQTVSSVENETKEQVTNVTNDASLPGFVGDVKKTLDRRFYTLPFTTRQITAAHFSGQSITRKRIANVSSALARLRKLGLLNSSKLQGAKGNENIWSVK